MTNAVTNFSQSKPAAAFQAALGAHPQESLAEGIGQSYGVLHYKGKVWTLRYRGQSYPITRPDDGSPVNAVEFIILRQAKSKSKSFYPKWDPNTSDGERPICSSLDGIVPDEDVQQKQANACAVCPRNVLKQMPDGRRRRECADYKRLAVLLLPSITTRLLGTPLMEPVFLRVPPASLNDLAVFGDRMNAMGWHFSSYITRASFDPTSEFPKFKFEEVQALTDAEAPVVLPMREDAQTLRITGEDKVSSIPGVASPLAIAAPVVETGLTTQAPVATAGRPEATQPSAPLVQHSVAPTPQAAPLMTGLVTANTVSPSKPVSDTGEITESDAELDAQIKSILGG